MNDRLDQAESLIPWQDHDWTVVNKMRKAEVLCQLDMARSMRRIAEALEAKP